jgi:DNA primase
MRYGPGLLEEILRRTDLVQLVGRRVKLARRGRVYWGLCPFHREKSPSFKVENERRNYKCFGCGAGGDAFRWLMETEGFGFPEAVEKLAHEAGVDLPKWSPQDEAREQQRKSLYEIVETACLFFEQQLRQAVGAAARSYLQSRGLGEDAWRQFRLGYAPPARRALFDHLSARGVSIEEAAAAGLAREGGEGLPARDFFFDRVMFPIGDAKARIVAFGARSIASDAKPKYINTGETSLFSKGRLLYNLSSARAAALKSGGLVVAEGYLDVIALVRAGVEAAVAPLGTAFTEDQLLLLWRTCAEPVFAFDGDDAGIRAARRTAELAIPLLKPGHSLRFAFLPAGEDPDSLIRAQGSGAMHAVLDRAIPLLEMIWRIETDDKSFETPERQAALLARLNERLRLIASADVRRFYLDAVSTRLSEQLGLRCHVYGEELRASAASPKKPSARGTRSRERFLPVSPAVRNSGLIPRDPGRAPERPLREALTEVSITRPPPPVTPKQSAADGVWSTTAERGPASARLKEAEVLALLLDAPEIIERQQEILASLPFADRSLDSLRHELLNVAASGFRLETGRLEDHLVRAGFGTLVPRLKTRRAGRPVGQDSARRVGDGGDVDVRDIEARWVRAASQLRELAEFGPERWHALERFKSEANEESWRDWHRLFLSGMPSDE